MLSAATAEFVVARIAERARGTVLLSTAAIRDDVDEQLIRSAPRTRSSNGRSSNRVVDDPGRIQPASSQAWMEVWSTMRPSRMSAIEWTRTRVPSG